MDEIKDSINNMFANLFNEEQHPFFTDMIKVNKLASKMQNHMKDSIKHATPYEKYNIQNNIINDKISHDIQQLDSSKYKVLKKTDIYKFYDEMSNVMNWNKLHHIVSKMSQYLLQTNIINEDKFYMKLHKNSTLVQSNIINIMIIGTGPIGLYLACYLTLYYNITSMNSSPRVNVVLFDSRIEKPGFRKPYNRQRPFATSSSYLNLIIPKIYCWNNDMKYLYVNIFMLEYILYTIAVTKYNIPIIYNDYEWNDYIKIIEKGNFNVVYDCSGGRLKNDAIKKVDPTWFTNLYKNKMNNNKLHEKLVIDNNIVNIENTSKKFMKNHYYGSVSVHKNDSIHTFIMKYDIDIINNNDLLYLNKMKKNNFTLDDIIVVIKGIKDKLSRNFLYSMFTEKKSFYKNCIFKIDVWSIYIRHAIKICDIIKVNNKKVLYVGAGDTIFHSHFIVGAGLNRILDFTVKCANKIIDLTL